MAKVFISYRRSDTAAFSGRIYDRLVAKFGKKSVFKDVDDIPAGVDFAEYIRQSLCQCAVVLVVIGSQWLDSRAADGTRRLDDPADFVRLEVETALAQGITVIPLLVDHASMPPGTHLPDSLQQLSRINALEVRNDPDFAHDVERVIAALERAFTSQSKRGLFGRRAPLASAPAASPEAPRQSPATQFAGSSPAFFPLLEVTATTVRSSVPTGPYGADDPSATHGWTSSAVAPPPAAAWDHSARGALVSPTPQAYPPAARSRASRPRISGFAGRPRISRMFGGTLAALLLVAAGLGVYLSSGGKPFSIGASGTPGATGGGSRPTQTAAVSPDSATATAYANLLFPYVAAAPGRPCDSGVAQWGSGPGLTCKSNPTRTHAANWVGIGWSYPYYNTAVPNNYTVSVQIANISVGERASLMVEFELMTGGAFTDPETYAVELHSDGSYAVTQHSDSPQPGSQTFNPNQPTTVSVRVTGDTITCYLNTVQVCGYTEHGTMRLGLMNMTVDSSYAPNSTGSADFMNFSLRP